MNDKSLQRFNDYMAKAQACLDAGFMSKAAQKRSMDYASSAAELIGNEIQSLILTHWSRDELYGPETGIVDLYYHQTRAHNWAKAAKMAHQLMSGRVDVSPLLALGDQAAALYALAKATEIKAPVRKADTVEAKAEAAVQKSIMAMLEERRAKYDRCLRLDELFGTMGITANVHVVHGHKGTVFLRAFYYSLGVLTPLGVIIAAMDEAKRRELAAS